ncbi:serine aminopeptidase domain-containing protein [Sulfitobacter sp. S190]|uniref:alpha/beta hydrolase family protein n=1 Tax=Sulfitobacter sp. S190 TaxID=2867022 RepID=UPI0021A73B2C|nr:alpha/beta hydrolase [Sulfitobacter sp. S190]UWR24564.1 alpha/beta hydrolase [Sulfitobacter sp. S190]
MPSATTADADVQQRPVTFASVDRTLTGTVFEPRTTPRAIVVLSPAVGVRARYYSAFADWLVRKHTVACLTYDYRDFGASSAGPTHRSDATLGDWAVTDGQSARAFAQAQFGELPQWIIGHSLGGMCLPLQTGLSRVARVITVGSGAVHAADHPWPYQALARTFWSWPVRGIVAAKGMVPGRLMGLGADLPAGVYRQWRRWCTTRGSYAIDIGKTLPPPNAEPLGCRVKFVAIADDALVPPAAVWRLMTHYGDTPRQQLTLKPSAFGLDAIGHIEVFSASRQSTWDAILA